MLRPWDDGSDSVENAIHRVRAASSSSKNWVPLSTPFTIAKWHRGQDAGRDEQESGCSGRVLKEEQQRTGIKLLWGTANLFSNPRFLHGASTSCNADALAFAAAGKKCLEVTKELGGSELVFGVVGKGTRTGSTT